MIIRYLYTQTKLLLISLCILITILIGIMRYFAGPEYALSLFYLFPIVIASWYVNKCSGIIISFFIALSWLYTDLQMADSFSNIFIPYINEIFRLSVLLFLANLIANFKNIIVKHKTIARTDSLTRIPNRLAFIEYAEIEMNKSQRLNRSMTIIYIDIDNFKVVNDTYGHQAGDELLSKVANTIKNNIRITDIVARLGGDEFAILMWRSSTDASNAVAIKLREKLLQLARLRSYPVTFSIGVATYKIIPDNIEEMIKQGDELMYLAKKSGKDCIKCQVI